MVDLNRYMYPPQIEKVKPALEIVEKIWLNSYKTVAGEDFIKLIKPGELLLVGGINLNKTGTIVLGVADAGMRITLFQTDFVDENDPKSVKKFIHTIQHEYIHILNQNKDFKQKEYGSITSEGYTSNWHEFTDMDSRELGYITSYARANVIEDFAEMASFMLVYSKSEYKEVLDRISNKKAVNSLKDKERFVVRYFREAHGIDFYALWEAAEQNTNEIINEKTS